MNRNQPEGVLRRTGRLVRNAFSGATGNTATQLNGEPNQTGGRVRDAYDQVFHAVVRR